MDKQLNRRDFLKVAAVSGAMAAGTGLAGCSPEETGNGDTAASAAAGTEWGTFDENGTFTPQFLIEPDPIPESDIKETFDADVVVVGMGLSGMCAARAAIEEGASVLLIEKGTGHHVHSHQFQAINCQAAKDVGCEVDQATIDLLIGAEVTGFRERIDQRMWGYLLNRCGEDFDWYLSLTDHYTVIDPNVLVKDSDLDAKAICNICASGLAPLIGRHFDDVSEEREQAARDAGPYISLFNHPVNPNWDIASERYPMSPGVVTIEPTHEVMAANLAAFIEANATVRYASWAKRLIKDKDTGRVTGIIFADINDNYYKVNAAKGIVLCTGDFAGNTQMLNYYVPRFITGGDLGWPDTDAKGNRTNMGEGLSMAHWVGAQVDTNFAYPNDHYGGGLGCDPMLFVDGNGERCMNEDVVGEILGEKVLRVAGKKLWQIFDADYPDQIANMPVGHRCFWKIVEDYDDIPMGLFLDPVGYTVPAEVDFCTTAICDTLEDLAKEMEVSYETLKATIDRYNEFAEKGVDEDFGKRPDRLAPVKTPPFHACMMPVLGYMTFYGSVCCDYEMHAIDNDNNAIPGLYVAGTISGSRFWQFYPNTAMGVNHAGCLVYGRLAGTNAAKGI